MIRKKLLILTNLYPLPWEPQRGMFNKQQFERLRNSFDVVMVIPLPFLVWLQNRHQMAIMRRDNIYCFPYVYTPGFGRSFYHLWMWLALRLTVLSRLRALDIDVVLGSWLFPDGVVAAKLAGLLKRPYLLKAHGTDINVYLDHGARGATILRACHAAGHVIVVSQALRQALLARGVAEHKVTTLYNGVDHRLFHPAEQSLSPDHKHHLLYVGNLKRDKGIVELLEAFILLKAQGGDYTLTIAGDGALRQELMATVSAHRLDDVVRFLGSVPHHQLPALMHAADLLCLPSHREGVPNVVLEAIACGLPVVATAVGGIPEVVNEGVNGLLVPVGDIPALQSAIQTAVGMSWSKQQIVASAAKYSWQHNIEVMVARLNDVIH